MIILINKISNAIMCSKSYDGTIISYTENKDKIRFI